MLFKKIMLKNNGSEFKVLSLEHCQLSYDNKIPEALTKLKEQCDFSFTAGITCTQVTLLPINIEKFYQLLIAKELIPQNSFFPSNPISDNQLISSGPFSQQKTFFEKNETYTQPRVSNKEALEQFMLSTQELAKTTSFTGIELSKLLEYSIEKKDASAVTRIVNYYKPHLSDFFEKSVKQGTYEIAYTIMANYEPDIIEICKHSFLDLVTSIADPFYKLRLTKALGQQFKRLVFNFKFYLDLMEEEDTTIFKISLPDSAEGLGDIIENDEQEKLSQWSLEVIPTVILESLMMFCAYKNKYHLAEIIFFKGLTKKEEYCSSKNISSSVPCYFNFEIHGVDNSKREAMASVLSQIPVLLRNKNELVRILGYLDTKIFEKQRKLNVDFSTLVPSEFVTRNGLRWPIPPADFQPIKCHSLLRVIIKECLSEFGLEDSGLMHTFCGFVSQKHANKVIMKGSLFKEFLGDNILYHGINSHELQTLVIALAMKLGIIKTELSLKEILQAFITTTTQKGKSTYWVSALDQAPSKEPNLMNFGSPHILNQAIFSLDSLPYLRGYFWNKWCSYVQKLLLTTEISSFEVLIVLSAIAHNLFGVFQPSPPNNAELYYSQDEHRKGGFFDKTTNIFTRSWAEREAFWKETLEPTSSCSI